MLNSDVSARFTADALKSSDASASLAVEGGERGVEVMVATTPDLMKRVYRLRYAVYCVEKQFEDPDLQITGFEQDRYDGHAVHALLMDPNSGADRGTVRLILPRKGETMPVYEVSDAFRDAAGTLFPAETTAEASRFLRAAEEGGARHSAAFETLALMAGLTRMCWENGISHLAALITPPMLRLLQRFGLAFKPLGEPVEFHGKRHACIYDLATELTLLAEERPEIWRVLTVGGHFYPRTAPYR